MNDYKKEKIKAWIGYILLALIWLMFFVNNGKYDPEEPCTPDYMGGCN